MEDLRHEFPTSAVGHETKARGPSPLTCDPRRGAAGAGPLERRGVARPRLWSRARRHRARRNFYVRIFASVILPLEHRIEVSVDDVIDPVLIKLYLHEVVPLKLAGAHYRDLTHHP